MPTVSQTQNISVIRRMSGIGIGLVLAPLLPVAGFNLSIWAGSPSPFYCSLFAIWPTAVFAAGITWNSIWVKLVVSLLYGPATYGLFVLYGLSYGCNLQLALDLPATACL